MFTEKEEEEEIIYKKMWWNRRKKKDKWTDKKVCKNKNAMWEKNQLVKNVERRKSDT